ncbi:MAG: hypothetical protein AAGU73_11555 [Actinomycetota bacterium]
MGGRFGQYEGEAEVRSKYPTHEEEPPPGFRRAQLLVALGIVGALAVVYILTLLLR